MDVIINSRNCRQRQYLTGKINDIDEALQKVLKKEMAVNLNRNRERF